MPVLKTAAKALPADERRSTIVAAVVALAATRNPAEISTTAIAQELGLTQGALFKHFPTKDALLVAVMEWVESTLFARLDAAEALATSPLHALELLFFAHVQFAVEHPGVPRIVFGELQRGTASAPRLVVQGMQKQYGERLRRLLVGARDLGLCAPQIDVQAAITLFVGSIQGLVVQGLMHDDITHVSRQARGVFALVRRALEANS